MLWNSLFLLLTIVALTEAGLYKTVYRDGYTFTYWGDGGDDTSWCNAVQSCTWIGGFLAQPKTALLASAVDEVIIDERVGWLGATDTSSEGYWRWMDGTPLSSGHTSWYQNQPDNVKNEDCMEAGYFGSHYWNDQPCGNNFGHVCQKSGTKLVSSEFSLLSFSDVTSDYSSRASYSDAQKACESKGLRLARVDEKDELEAMRMKLKSKPDAKYWIGTKHGECVYVSYTNRLQSGDCSQSTLHYICEEVTPWGMQLSDEEVKVHENKNIEVECKAKGFPLPDVAWYKDDELISDKTDQHIHQSIGSATSTLVINNAQLSDADRYRCFATNSAIGFAKNVMAFVDLEVYPEGAEIYKTDEEYDFFDEIKKLKKE